MTKVAPSLAETSAKLIPQEARDKAGAIAWLMTGLQLEELQYVDS